MSKSRFIVLSPPQRSSSFWFSKGLKRKKEKALARLAKIIRMNETSTEYKNWFKKCKFCSAKLVSFCQNSLGWPRVASAVASSLLQLYSTKFKKHLWYHLARRMNAQKKEFQLAKNKSKHHCRLNVWLVWIHFLCCIRIIKRLSKSKPVNRSALQWYFALESKCSLLINYSRCMGNKWLYYFSNIWLCF